MSRLHEVRISLALDMGTTSDGYDLDYSTYHSFWVQGQARRGVDVGGWYDEDYGY